MRVPGARIAFRLDFEKLCGVVEDRCLRRLLRLAPATVAQCAQRGDSFSDTDVSRDEEGLPEWHIESCIIREFQDHNFLLRAILLQRLDAAILADPMLKMDDQIPVDDFGK